MRILHVINNLNSGGAEKLLVDTLPLYKKAGLEIEVLQLSNHDSVFEYVDKLRKNGVHVQHLSNGSIYSILNILKLVKFLRKRKTYDIIHVHLFPALYWMGIASRLISKKTCLVFTEHSTQNKRFDRWYLKLVDRFIYGYYDQVIAISEAIGSKVIAWTNMPSRIRVIRNGVNIEHFRNAPTYPATFWAEEIGLPQNSIKIMMTARFSYPKDHHTVLEALSKLPKAYQLIFVGEGDQLNYTKQMVQSKGLQSQVTFLGFRKDVPSLMKSVDINILSSRYEGMSGVSLEALAAQKPFLGSNVSGINDVVPDDRFLFEAGNAFELAQKIEGIQTDRELKQNMISDGISLAENLDVMNTVELHKTLYQSLVKKKSFV